jgi:predicted dithiol-disulfide oxidoreductase (DUF899 family)
MHVNQSEPQIVSQEQWLAARRKYLEKEKEVTRLQDELLRQRRALPWVKIEKPYTFDGPHGKETLAQLFDGRSQLIVQHFMFGPGWEEGCVGCSFKADHVDSANQHLMHHDVTFVSISRATLPEIEAFKKRMGWKFKWVSSYGTDFNYDFHVSFPKSRYNPDEKVYYNYELQPFESEELPGTSVFYKDTDGSVYHTYSSYGRGDESLVGAYAYLDMTPKGRNENGPNKDLTDWVRHHDKYDAQPANSTCCSH